MKDQIGALGFVAMTLLCVADGGWLARRCNHRILQAARHHISGLVTDRYTSQSLELIDIECLRVIHF